MRYLSILLIAGLSGCSATPHNVDAERQNRDFEAIGVPQQLPRDTLRDF